MYRLSFSELYDSDVDSCYSYIRNRLQAPVAADNLIIEIKENPNARPLVRDAYLASLGYRLINVKNYIIFYIIGDDDSIGGPLNAWCYKCRA